MYNKWYGEIPAMLS